MHDYDNMPALDWNDAHSVVKARAQILHQEPVILQMPDHFNYDTGDAPVDCRHDNDPGMLLNCDGGQLLNALAENNAMPELKSLAEACIESGSRVDVDITGNRLIVHD